MGVLAAAGTTHVAPAQAPTITLSRQVRLWDVLPDGGGRPTSVSVDRQGRIAIAQRGPARVFVLDSSGRLLRTIGRDGRGPGEFLFPRVALWGDSVVVWDGQQRRLSVFAMGTGELQRVLSVPVSGTLVGVAAPDHVYIRNTGSPAERAETGASAIRVTLAGRVVDTLEHIFVPEQAAHTPTIWRARLPGSGGFATAIPYTTRPLVALHPDGTLAVSTPLSHEVIVLADRSASRVIYRHTGAPVAIPRARRQAARDSALAADAQGADRTALEQLYRLEDIPGHYPPWSRIEFAGNGTLMLTDPGAPPGTVRFVPVSSGARAAALELPANQVGELRSWAGAWLVSLVDTDAGTLLTIFRVR